MLFCYILSLLLGSFHFMRWHVDIMWWSAGTAPFNSDVLFRGIASSEDDGIKLAVRPGSLGNKARL